MGWYIFGVIALCIVLFLLKNAYRDRTAIHKQEEYDAFGKTYTRRGKLLGYEYSNKVKMPLWLFAILVIPYLIPGLNIIIFFVEIFIIIYGVYNDVIFIHLSENTLMDKIVKFLNKDVF